MCIISTKDKIQSLRKQHQLTQQELADRLHTSRSTIANWETGRTIPNLDAIQKISALFEKSPAYFIEQRNEHRKLLFWTAPDERLNGLNIQKGDLLTFRAFTQPRDGMLMLLKNTQGKDQTFAALVERYEDQFFYRLSMEKRIHLKPPVEPLGYCIHLDRSYETMPNNKKDERLP